MKYCPGKVRGKSDKEVCWVFKTNSFNYKKLNDLLHLPDKLLPRHKLLLRNVFTSE